MRFRPNMRNINGLMKSDQAGAEVRRVAERIAEGAAGEGGEFKTDSALGSRRWRAAVIGNYKKHGDAAGTRAALLRNLRGGG